MGRIPARLRFSCWRALAAPAVAVLMLVRSDLRDAVLLIDRLAAEDGEDLAADGAPNGAPVAEGARR